MAKLKERKIKWIIREMENVSAVSGMAKTQKVSRRWVNDLSGFVQGVNTARGVIRV